MVLKLSSYMRTITTVTQNKLQKAYKYLKSKLIMGFWLDRMKPSTQIRAIGPGRGLSSSSGNPAKHVPKYGQPQPPRSGETSSFGNSNSKSKRRRLFTSSMSFMSKSRPTWMKIIRPSNPIRSNTQYKNLSTSALGMSTITNGINKKE
ncbi:hypothetical protein MKX01_035146 [Papaver californicum]|nr:hypothetical protein MKX01_035146 [Papaver californicum]